MEEEIEQARQEVRDCLGQPERQKLMQLVDTQNLLREEISPASFIAGFKLAQEIAKEPEVVTHGKKRATGEGNIRKRKDGRWEGRSRGGRVGHGVGQSNW